MSTQLPLFHPPKTRESLSNDIWRACDTLCVRRDNNCGGVMEHVEHLAWLLFLRSKPTQPRLTKYSLWI
jgi:hypothetical protein